MKPIKGVLMPAPNYGAKAKSLGGKEDGNMSARQISTLCGARWREAFNDPPFTDTPKRKRK